MTRILRVIQQTQEKDFENECHEGITAQKLVTRFWGCYTPWLTQELWTSGAEHRSQVRDEHRGTSELLAWSPRARARCDELRHRRASGGSYGGGYEDGGKVWHALASWAASTRPTEVLATRRARLLHATTLGRTQSPCEP